VAIPLLYQTATYSVTSHTHDWTPVSLVSVSRSGSSRLKPVAINKSLSRVKSRDNGHTPTRAYKKTSSKTKNHRIIRKYKITQKHTNDPRKLFIQYKAGLDKSQPWHVPVNSASTVTWCSVCSSVICCVVYVRTLIDSSSPTWLTLSLSVGDVESAFNRFPLTAFRNERPCFCLWGGHCHGRCVPRIALYHLNKTRGTFASLFSTRYAYFMCYRVILYFCAPI